MRLLPGVRYENTVDSLGMSFGTSTCRTSAARAATGATSSSTASSRNEVGTSGLMAQQINLDAIAEVRVLLNSYRAEYGRAGGGQVQIVSKSGTSSYHGNLYYYGRNEALNATDFFVNRAEPSKKPAVPLQHLRRKPRRPGSEAGQESCSSSTRWKRRSSAARTGAQLDDADRRARCRGTSRRRSTRQGRLINIQDPLRDGRVQCRLGRAGLLPGNIIPANRINSSGRALLNMLPRANNFDRDVHAGTVTTTRRRRTPTTRR